MSEMNLLPVTTSLVSEEHATTLALGEEFTTEALGEEGPTTTSGENPSALGEDQNGGKGPFGSF